MPQTRGAACQPQQNPGRRTPAETLGDPIYYVSSLLTHQASAEKWTSPAQRKSVDSSHDIYQVKLTWELFDFTACLINQ